MQKDQKSLRARNKCPPPSSWAGGRKSRSTGLCHSSNTAAFHRVSLVAPSCQVSVFGSFLHGNVCAIHASVWSCLSSSCVCGKHNQREKSMYPQAIKKPIAFIESKFSVEWCSESLFRPPEICDPFFYTHLFINHYFMLLNCMNHTFMNFISFWQIEEECIGLGLCPGARIGGDAVDGNVTISISRGDLMPAPIMGLWIYPGSLYKLYYILDLSNINIAQSWLIILAHFLYDWNISCRWLCNDSV